MTAVARSLRPRVPSQRALILVAIVVGFIVFGATRDAYMQQVIGTACLYAVVALSLDLVWGYMGILSMGHAAFFGLGAYAVGLSQVRVNDSGGIDFVEQHWWTFPAGLLAGIVVVAAFAAFIGAAAFYARKVTPFYIAVVTLSVTVVLSTVLLQIDFLGGQQGLSGFPILTISEMGWFAITIGTLLVAWIAATVVVRSDFGLLMRAIRDNEQRCRYLGYNVALVKTLTFTGSAALAALAGGLFAGYVGFVSPPFVGFLIATNIIIWVAVGGRGTLVGPVLGAVAINLAGADLSARFPFVWTLVLGAIFVAVVVFVPDGLLPGIGRVVGKVAPRLVAGPGTYEREIVGAKGVARADDQTSAEPDLAVDDVHLSFGSLKVLRGVSLDVRRGELLCIVGPNGAGKSTLLGVITDGSVSHEGSVTLGTADGPVALKGKRPGDIVRAGVGRKFQNPNLFESLTPVETILLASRRGRVPSLVRRSRVIEVSPEAQRIFDLTAVDRYANVKTEDLSHGVKQAVEVVMTVALSPRVLLLDEPTAGLTLAERSMIGQLLRSLVAEGTTIVLIEHDFDFVRSIADRIAVLHDGRVLETGTADEIGSSELVRRVYLGAAA